MSQPSNSNNAFFDVVCNQRAYRDLLSDPVPHELIEKILVAGTHAPSSKNSQPWRFVVVQEANIRSQIASFTREAWESFGRATVEDTTTKSFRDTEIWATEGFGNAPVIIVICGDTSVLPMGEMDSSIYPAAQNILLAASALGLGSLMALLPVFAADQALSKLLKLPDHIVPMATLPVGYPARKLGPPARRPIEEITSRDQFGAAW